MNGNGNPRILVVDDDPMQIQQVVYYLSEKNYQLVTATDGVDALKKYPLQTFDLLLVDLQMPLLDGPGLIKAIYQINRDIPIIVMTSHSDAYDPYVLLDDFKIFDFLSKPCSAKQLQFTVRNALEKSHYIAGFKNQSRKLQLANELTKEAAHAKAVFLSRISHELRTPLNAVLGFGQLLKCDNADIQQSADEIVAAGHQMLSLVDNLIALTNVSQDESTLPLHECELNPLIKITTKEARNDALAANVTLKVDLPEESLKVYANEGALMSVLGYLIDNAIKFNRQHGNVSITTVDGINDIKINVKDSGIGIDEKYHLSVFEAFSQLDQQINKAGAGVGIGLTRCQSLVEKMNGQIVVNSHLGLGSEFAVFLPKANASDGN